MARIDPSDCRRTLLFTLATSQIAYAINNPESLDALPVPATEMYSNPEDAHAIREYRFLAAELAADIDGHAQLKMLALERDFPHLNFSQILQIAGALSKDDTFHEFPYFDSLSGTFEHPGQTTLYIQRLDGAVWTLRFEHMRHFNQLMICEIKLEIMDQWGIPIAQQQLIFEDEILMDSRSLRSYNIQNGSTICLVQLSPPVQHRWSSPAANDEEDRPDDEDNQEEPEEDDEGDDEESPPPSPPSSNDTPPENPATAQPPSKDDSAESSQGVAPETEMGSLPTTHHRASRLGSLHDIVTDKAEAAAVYEYHLLSDGGSPCSLARQSMRAIEDAFPHLDFPEILRMASTFFPECLEQPPDSVPARQEAAKLHIQCLN